MTKLEELKAAIGPAIERRDGDKAWYLNGKWHREDGPAVEDDDAWVAVLAAVKSDWTWDAYRAALKETQKEQTND
jgi:hypothetical protein